MENKYMERFVGRYCKVVTKEPGEKKATITTGLLEEVDYEDGFIIIDSHQGLGALRISTIIAIKPAKHKQQQHKRSIKADSQAVVGIETLIVFIAMVLVAAVTSTVLIQTMDTLQQRSRYISDQTIKEVSSGLQISEVTGYTDASISQIEYLALQVRTTPGSKDIDLSLATLSVLYANDVYVLELNESYTYAKPEGEGIFGNLTITASPTIDGLDQSTFGLCALHDPDGSLTGGTTGINTGDVVLIIIDVTDLCGGLGPRESLSGSLQPESGMKASFDIVTPAVFGQRTVDFY
jgi:archaeal flagellin FlaB